MTDPQSWVPIELDTFNALLDWLQNAGQPGGAPAGVVVQTVRQVVNGSRWAQAKLRQMRLSGRQSAGED